MVIVLVVVAISAIFTRAFHLTATQAKEASTTARSKTPSATASQPSAEVPVLRPSGSGNSAVKTIEAPAPKAETVTRASAKLTARRTEPRTVAVDFDGCREIATVHFTANSSELSPEEVANLRKSFSGAGELSGKLKISAYCDDIGAANWNVILSQRRANAVAKAIASIQPDLQLETKGLGSDDPIVPNRTWKARAQNRRAEVRICGPKSN